MQALCTYAEAARQQITHAKYCFDGSLVYAGCKARTCKGVWGYAPWEKFLESRFPESASAGYPHFSTY